MRHTFRKKYPPAARRGRERIFYLRGGSLCRSSYVCRAYSDAEGGVTSVTGVPPIVV